MGVKNHPAACTDPEKHSGSGGTVRVWCQGWSSRPRLHSLLCNITTVEECGEPFCDVGWHDSFKGSQIDLHYVSTVT